MPIYRMQGKLLLLVFNEVQMLSGKKLAERG